MDILGADILGRGKEDALGEGGEDTQHGGGMAGVGFMGARRAKIQLEKPARGHQSQPGIQT